MNLRPTLSTPEHSYFQPCSWESAAMGVEFLFTGGSQEFSSYISIRESIQQIGNNLDGRKDLLAADPRIEKRSGRYGQKRAVPT